MTTPFEIGTIDKFEESILISLLVYSNLIVEPKYTMIIVRKEVRIAQLIHFY